MTWLSELLAGMMLLTRLPLARFAPPGEMPIGAIIWTFPVVGAVVGLVGGVAYAGCIWLGMPAAVAAIWALAVMVLATGAFHEDGLADTADGFGGGRTRERKLEIMRDSRIGGFGAIALILAFGVRGVAIASLGSPLRVLLALVVAASLGRAAMIVMVLLLGPARRDGLAAGLQMLGPMRAIGGLAIAVLLAFLLLPIAVALRATGVGLLAALVMAWIAQRQIGGYTGDVLGAGAVLAECAALSLLAGS